MKAIQKTRRPRLEKAQLLEAATQVFLSKGYHKATIADLVGRSGGSNRNIYTKFGDKFGLYCAVLERFRDRLLSALDAIQPSGSTTRAKLIALGRGYLRHALQKDAMDLHRLVVSEAATLPDLGSSVIHGAEKLIITRASALLSEATAAGELEVKDPDLIAGMFLAAVRGEMHLQASYMALDGEFSGQIDSYVEQVVDVFFDGLGPRRKPVRRAG